MNLNNCFEYPLNQLTLLKFGSKFHYSGQPVRHICYTYLKILSSHAIGCGKTIRPQFNEVL